MRGLRLGFGMARGAVGSTVSANPDFTNLAFTAGGSGVEDSLAATYTYAGNYPLVFRGVTSTVATPPGADGAAIRANIIAGTGTGNVEEFAIDPFSGSTLNITAGQLTGASDSATHIHGFVEEKNSTGFSEVRTVAVSGLNISAPTVTWATNLAGTQVIGTANETIFGTGVTGNWTVPGHTVTGATVSGTTITLTVSPLIVNGDTDTVSYSGGNLENNKGTALANITSASITNNVPVPATPPSILANTQAISQNSDNNTSVASAGITAQTGTNRLAMLIVSAKSNSTTSLDNIAATWGSQSFTRLYEEGHPTSGVPGSAIFYMKSADIPAGSNVITITATGMNRVYARLVEWASVDQTTPFGTPVVGNTATSQVATQGVTVNLSLSTSVMVSHMASQTDIVSPMTVSAGTELFDIKVGFGAGAGAAWQAPGVSGNNTHTYTFGGSGQIAYGAVELRGA
jgi:hypothetical protein